MPAAVHLVVAAFVFLAAGYAVAIPPWNNPDEPAHFNYIRQLADHAELPILESGAWDAALLERLKASRFRDASIDSITYEAHQPPLYYALEAPLYVISRGLPLSQAVLVLRGLSILLGALVVYLAAAIMREVKPGRGDLAVLAASVVAFLPMFTSISAAINNDALANLVGAALVLLGVRGLNRGFRTRDLGILGGLVGVALLTKTTVYALLPVLVLALVWRRRIQDRAPWPLTLRDLAIVAGIALVVGGWWFIRNAGVYGWLDPLASARHDQVVVGQLRSDDPSAPPLLSRLLTVYESFWGIFGWMGVPLPDGMYLAFGALVGAVAAGAVAWMPLDSVDRRARLAVPWLLLSVVVVGVALAGYNRQFVQSQARYLFPSLIAMGAVAALWLGSLLTAGRGPAALRAFGAGFGLLALGVVAIEAASVVFTGLPRRLAYLALVALIVLFEAAVAGRNLSWGGPARLALAVLSLAWADIALLFGVAAPAFR